MVGVDGTLFGFWYVTIHHDAYCGHDMCGPEATIFTFGHGQEAIKFIRELPESALEHEPSGYI
jgi:hypothetical protein